MSTLKRDHFKRKGLRVCLPSRKKQLLVFQGIIFQRQTVSLSRGVRCDYLGGSNLEGLSDRDMKRMEDEIEVEDILPTQYVIPKSLKV